MKALKKAANWSLMVSEVLAGLFLGVLLLVVLWEIVARRLGMAVAWTDELARYLMIWGAYFAVPVAYRRGQHVGLTAILNRLPRILRNLLALAIHLGVLFSGFVMIWQGLAFLPKLTRQFSASLGFPMSYTYAGVLIGGFLLISQAGYLVADSVKRLKEER